MGPLRLKREWILAVVTSLNQGDIKLFSRFGCDQLMHLEVLIDVELFQKFSVWHHAQSVNEVGSCYGESLIQGSYFI